MTRYYRCGDLSLRLIREAYRCNLRRVLKSVRELVDKIGIRPIVVTSDHGELLGEDNMIDHPCRYRHPALNNVPFLIIR